MSASATFAWYIDMWVKAPLPTMSPIAHSLSPARIRASVSTDRAVGVEPDRLEAEVGDVGPPAGRDEQPVGREVERGAAGVGERHREPAVGVVHRPDLRAGEHLDAVGRHRARDDLRRLRLLERRGCAARASTSETVVPKRAKAWASSAPIAPPPMTTIEAGRSGVASTSRLVQNGVSARPSTGGAAGEVPVLSTTPREAA